MSPTLPGNLAAERAVLGAVLCKPEFHSVASEILHAADFSTDANRRIFSAMAELAEVGDPIDEITLLERLDKLPGADALLADLVNGVVATSQSIKHHAKTVRDAASLRRVYHAVDSARLQLLDPGASLAETESRITELLAEVQKNAAGSESIRSLSDIPDLFAIALPEQSYLVPGLIVEESLTQWAGRGGCGKSYLMTALAIAVATGSEFLGRQCRRSPVLILDYEMTGSSMRDRLESIAGGPVPGLHVWGGWCAEPAPLVSDLRLLEIAKGKPLIVVDPLRLAHRAEDENSADDMTPVMGAMRRLVHAGATVIFIHHAGKSEGSAFRGSSALSDLSDSCLLQSRDEETGLIKLAHTKARFFESITLTIRPDFEAGRFEVTDSPQFTERSDTIRKLSELITAQPGLSQNELTRLLGISKVTAASLLKGGVGTHWRVEQGTNRSKRYFTLSGSVVSEPLGTTGTPKVRWSSGSLSFRREPPNHPGANHPGAKKETLQ